ncbi:Aste57867_1440 [Aphanomyces stellatus]|uniref:Aste57867_1440 protein n=1 Tax=Aphanomyces stellatus TaxID=120398 RepID=A0A485K6G3_9STRA|nr:hypothetical protein As57867_001439 [Aphanomyces stellatus]VFT78657.1 Aste57867_1440 [Aphanomyces stellatus]
MMRVVASAKRAFSTVSIRPLWMLRYNYVDGMLEKRDPFRKDHLSHIERLAKAGDDSDVKMIMAGAFADPVDGAAFVLEAANAQQVEAFAKKDPYVINNLVTKFDVRVWNVVEFK